MNVLPVDVFPALAFFAVKKTKHNIVLTRTSCVKGKTYFAVKITAGKGMCQVCLSRRASEPLQSDVM